MKMKMEFIFGAHNFKHRHWWDFTENLKLSKLYPQIMVGQTRIQIQGVFWDLKMRVPYGNAYPLTYKQAYLILEGNADNLQNLLESYFMSEQIHLEEQDPRLVGLGAINAFFKGFDISSPHTLKPTCENPSNAIGMTYRDEYSHYISDDLFSAVMEMIFGKYPKIIQAFQAAEKILGFEKAREMGQDALNAAFEMAVQWPTSVESGLYPERGEDLRAISEIRACI